jgi:hypothetical protein
MQYFCTIKDASRLGDPMLNGERGKLQFSSPLNRPEPPRIIPPPQRLVAEGVTGKIQELIRHADDQPVDKEAAAEFAANQ